MAKPSPAQLAARRKFAAMARARAKAAKSSSTRRRRRRSSTPATVIVTTRRSPVPMARKSRKSRKSTRARRRGVSSRGFILGLPKDVPIAGAAAVGGILGSRFVLGKVLERTAPGSFLAGPWGQALAKAAVGLGLFMALKRVNPSLARGAAIGAMADAGLSVVQGIRNQSAQPAVAGYLDDSGVAGYLDDGMSGMGMQYDYSAVNAG